MSTKSSYDQFLADFRETVVNATARLKDITPEDSRHKSGDDWAPIEILGHLVDSATNNHQRFVRAQFTDDLAFPGYDQDGWVNSQKYHAESWPDLIQLWSAYNLHLVHVASVIPPDVLTKLREKHTLNHIALNPVPPDEPATLEYLIRDYVVHLHHHLDQIFGKTS